MIVALNKKGEAYVLCDCKRCDVLYAQATKRLNRSLDQLRVLLDDEEPQHHKAYDAKLFAV